MDAFFASVEQLLHPEYRGKPVIVGARPGQRGVVSTASYEARTYGIHSAMPISKAYQLCPKGIFVSGNHKTYSDFSRKIQRLFSTFTPLVEMASIDEAFLDVTGCPHLPENWRRLGEFIRGQISETIHLPASIGIAPNKFLAKIASDLKKPQGLVTVTESEKQRFLAPLPIQRMWGVGEKSASMLIRDGIRTIGDMQKYDENYLARRYGKFGSHLFYLAHGIDNRPVTNDHIRKSIGRETTFQHDSNDRKYLYTILGTLAQDIGTRLRAKGILGTTITLKVRYNNFSTHTKRKTLSLPQDADHIIFNVSKELFDSISIAQKVRLLGISVSGLCPSAHAEQMDLFNQQQDTQNELYASIDQIRKKYGTNSIIMGNTLPNS